MEYIGSSFINLLYKERASIALTLSSESSECFLENTLYSLFYSLDNFSTKQTKWEFSQGVISKVLLLPVKRCSLSAIMSNGRVLQNTMWPWKKIILQDLLPDEKILINTPVFFTSIDRNGCVYLSSNSIISKNVS